jgi:hypothetical protein
MLRISSDNPLKSVASVKIRGSIFCLTGRNDNQRPFTQSGHGRAKPSAHCAQN